MPSATAILLASVCSLATLFLSAAASSNAEDCRAEASSAESILLQRIGELSRNGLVAEDLQSVAGCYGELAELVAEEGSGIGVPKLATQSVDDCKSACDAEEQCHSVVFCPEWWGCWLKDRRLDGSEATQASDGGCRSLYKMPCGGGGGEQATTTTTVPAGSGGSLTTIRVASYNLYWWNAFRDNPSHGVQVTDNIRERLDADVLGLQECDEPSLIETRTGYSEVSPFKGAQGIVARLGGDWEQVESGFQDIDAAGKWGARYVTWARLMHKANGRSFWHFNTHWCVHSGRGRTCNPEKRFQGARNMVSAIREKAGDAPVIITGDFNAAMSEPGPQHILQSGFTMAVTEWVDAIFFSSSHWRALWTGRGSAAGSDHRPVIAELELLAAER